MEINVTSEALASALRAEEAVIRVINLFQFEPIDAYTIKCIRTYLEEVANNSQGEWTFGRLLAIANAKYGHEFDLGTAESDGTLEFDGPDPDSVECCAEIEEIEPHRSDMFNVKVHGAPDIGNLVASFNVDSKRIYLELYDDVENRSAKFVHGLLDRRMFATNREVLFEVQMFNQAGDITRRTIYSGVTIVDYNQTGLECSEFTKQNMSFHLELSYQKQRMEFLN